MNNLFELTINDNNTSLEINPMLLAIKEFDVLWKRDKTKNKEKVLKELTYIYGMCSTDDDNIWKDFTNMKDRSSIIITDIFGVDSTWEPDREILFAIEKYKSRFPQDPGELLLETLKDAMIKIKDHIQSINYDEKDTNGRPIYNPKDVIILAKNATTVYSDMEGIIEKIRSNKKIKSDRLKGGSEEGMFETDELMKHII
jgi:hypothetical protein